MHVSPVRVSPTVPLLALCSLQTPAVRAPPTVHEGAGLLRPPGIAHVLETQELLPFCVRDVQAILKQTISQDLKKMNQKSGGAIF